LILVVVFDLSGKVLLGTSTKLLYIKPDKYCLGDHSWVYYLGI